MEQMTVAEIQEEITTAEKVDNRPLTGGYTSAEFEKKSGCFIVTAVQNNTDVHIPFWSALQRYARVLEAEIICCPILYNKNAFAQPDDVQDVYFASEFKPFMMADRMLLNENVLVVGNAHVLPTAANPLSNFAAVCEDGMTVVIPASKIALECLPVLKGQEPRTLLSTGTATQKNYIQRKAGVVAELTHRFGAVIVERGRIPRSIYWQNDCFFDYDGSVIKQVSEYGIDSGFDTCMGEIVLTLGDIHSEKCSQERLNVICEIVENLKPSHLVCEDTLDFSSRNHHHQFDAFKNHQFDVNGDSVQGDINKAKYVIKALQSVMPDDGKIVLVDSNHDRALHSYIVRQDFKQDMKNAEFFLKMALAYVKAINKGEEFNPIAYALIAIKGLTILSASDSYVINGCEFAHHGDVCSGGARGSLKGFAKLAQSLVVGHSHSPGIQGQAYQVGVSGDMQMGYNEKGASAWRHAHCVTFPNGQNQLYFE